MASSAVLPAEPIAPVPRALPPAGVKFDGPVRQQLEQRLGQVQERFRRHADHPLAPDVEVFVTAVRLALKFSEFYGEDDPHRAMELLHAAADRLDALGTGTAPWTDAHGLIVRGYRSSIDDSVQPYGLVIPEGLDLTKPAPLYVWLHGRGDQTTNLSFLHQRQTQPSQVTPQHAIVLHPWGRYCLGYKSAGEIDVWDAVEHTASQYNIDRRRIVLIGFSMGGAGCWHLGAHYPDRWVAMSPGAGFVETARYQNINPDDVVWYERRLWGMYDVPRYVRNLFNLPVVAYSGENDKQIQAARVMEEAFAAEGAQLNHRIGPGMGHRYHPETLAAILEEMQTACDRGLDPAPRRITLQTQTLRYHRVHWVDVQRLEEHWRDSRVDAAQSADGKLQLTTRNIAALRLTPAGLAEPAEVSIDGQTLQVVPDKVELTGRPVLRLVKQDGRWSAGEPDPAKPAKRPGLQGPIDDAFLDPFLVVIASGRSSHPNVQQWVEFEQQHFLDRWEALFRGQARVKRDVDVTSDDLARYHLVLWGDPTSNKVLSRIAERLPIRWTQEAIIVGDQRFPAAEHVLTMISPNPEAPDRYVVLNSGPTFREGHDRTNSLQNPKLPDWAVLELSQPPDALSPGGVVAADFFDESWQVRGPPSP
ncbi:MAG: prolyl oligopeptidase family serine peptidase [Planctomycetaceae bacterium]